MCHCINTKISIQNSNEWLINDTPPYSRPKQLSNCRHKQKEIVTITHLNMSHRAVIHQNHNDMINGNNKQRHGLGRGAEKKSTQWTKTSASQHITSSTILKQRSTLPLHVTSYSLNLNPGTQLTIVTTFSICQFDAQTRITTASTN